MTGADRLKQRYDEWFKWRYPNVPEYAKTYPPYISKTTTTNGLTRAVVEYILLMGWDAKIQQNQGRFIKGKKVVVDAVGFSRTIGTDSFVPGVNRKGISDITAFVDGVSLEIEIKNEKTKDRMSEYQIIEKQRNELFGQQRRYVVYRNFDEAVNDLDQYRDNPRKLEVWEVNSKK